MTTRLDYNGQTFNRLTIMEDAPDEGRYRMVKTKCSCGKEKILRLYQVTTGRVKSCGCLLKDHRAKLKAEGWDRTGGMRG